MPPSQINDVTIRRLFSRAGAERWNLLDRDFAEALEASANKAFAGKTPSSRELERYLESLHLADLALACACAAGHDPAWEHFVREQRPGLYRAADAIDPSGGARDLADSLYADLYGLTNRDGIRRSLFRYFHGRSSLSTWLRAVLAQRHVDRLRAQRRIEPLPDEESPGGVVGVAGVGGVASPGGAPDPDRHRYLTLIEQALGRAVSRLDPRDRLRLGCYYAQDMTLAQIGHLLSEHEATVSRHLARTRKAIRAHIEHQLKADAGLTEGQLADCFQSVMDDAGSIDLNEMLAAGDRKESGTRRSK
jgi:RNA polymerase sigma-70 factor (ECF subfamily)